MEIDTELVDERASELRRRGSRSAPDGDLTDATGVGVDERGALRHHHHHRAVAFVIDAEPVEDVGIDGGGASAEEAAGHIVEP